ncbi:hypothetical protein ACFL40_05630 [candidate division KSB1 bacterium]
MTFLLKLNKKKALRLTCIFTCLLIFLCVVNPIDSYGQRRPGRLGDYKKRLEEKEFMVGVEGVLGLSLLSQTKINQWLEAENSVPSNPLKPEKPYIGLSGFMIYNRYVLGLDAGRLWRSASTSTGVDAEYSGNMIFANLGYILVREENGRGYPYLGIGLGSSSINLNNHMDEPFLFGEGDPILSPPNTTGKLKFNTFLIQGGYQLIRTFPLSGTRIKQKGIHFSLKAGFILGLGGNKWELNGVELTDSPKASFNQVYARLTIGGWYSKIFEKE